MDSFGSAPRSGLRCDVCGTSEVTDGIENVPPEMRAFIRGEVIKMVQPLGICGECYAVLCSKHSRNGRCSKCDAPYLLFARCPTKPPPWWQLAKRRKWQQVRESE